MDKKAKADEILAEVDALFHTAEKSSQYQEVTYLDVVRITDRIREHFPDGVPSQIEHALKTAICICHPKRFWLIQLARKGIGYLVACGGGVALLCGVVTVLVHGLAFTVTHKLGTSWWTQTTTETCTNWKGPVGIAIGIAAIPMGIFLLSAGISGKQRAIAGLDMIRVGFDTWVSQEPTLSNP
jgi:hypothetical protein